MHIEKTVGPDGKVLHKCRLCGKCSKYSTHMVTHVEGNHLSGVMSYPCDYCEDVLGTKCALDCHIRRKHAPNVYSV